MVISIDKILNISLGDWMKASDHGRLWHYDMVGVTVGGFIGDEKSPKPILAKVVPEDTEIVINYDIRISGAGSACFYFEANGVVLIPKSKPDKK